MLLAQYTDRLISDTLKQSEYEYRKAKIVLYTQITLLFMGAVLWAISLFIQDDIPFPYHIALPLAGILIATFPYIQNLKVIGNIMAGIIAFFLVPMTLQGGGLYSDNLIWLLVVPLMAFFLADIRSGILWTLGLISFQTWLFFQELQKEVSFIEQMRDITPGYYYVSFLFLLSVYGSHHRRF